MAEQRIPHANGTVTVISDSYAPFGEIGGQASRPERDFTVRTTTLRDLRKCLRRCSDEEFQRVISTPGFPKPIGRSGLELTNPWNLGSPYYATSQINDWLRDQHALAALLPKEI
jgi:hypothetical protein